MAEQAFGYKAIKPFQAEHPLGSGTVVDYQPGDEVPADDWGRAGDNMVEAGRIMRYARNVYEFPEQVAAAASKPTKTTEPDAPPEATTADELAAGDREQVDDDFVIPAGAEFPIHKGGPLWVLSDRTVLRGRKADALAAQANLDVASEENEDADEGDGG